MIDLAAIQGVLKALLFGFIFMFAATFQQTNSAKNRWLLALPTSLVVSSCTWVNVHYIVTSNIALFTIFAVGAALGSSLGIYYGHKHRG